MAESITQFELQNDETSGPREEQDDQTDFHKEEGSGELNKSICIGCLHSFVRSSIHPFAVSYRPGSDWIGLGSAGLVSSADARRARHPSGQQQGAEEIIDRWAILPHAFQGSVATRASGASETSPEGTSR